NNTTGGSNTAIGTMALDQNTTGNANVATGLNSLISNEDGNFNVAYGADALIDATGDNNTALGKDAGENLTTGSFNTDIGNSGKNGDSGAIRIGGATQADTYIAGISGTTLGAEAQPVVIKDNGKLGVAPAVATKASTTTPLNATVGRLAA